MRFQHDPCSRTKLQVTQSLNSRNLFPLVFQVRERERGGEEESERGRAKEREIEREGERDRETEKERERERERERARYPAKPRILQTIYMN